MFRYAIMGLLILCLRKSIKLDKSVSILGLITSCGMMMNDDDELLL